MRGTNARASFNENVRRASGSHCARLLVVTARAVDFVPDYVHPTPLAGAMERRLLSFLCGVHSGSELQESSDGADARLPG